jgi:uncharacterized protein (TIGR03437 family)
MKTHARNHSFGRLRLLGLGLGLALVGLLGAANKVEAAGTLGLVNAASYETTTVNSVTVGVVAPGSIASLFADTTATGEQVPTSLPLPTTLAGVTVRINGVAAPLFYAARLQVNLQIPHATAAGNATVEVFIAGTAAPVATGIVVVTDTAPGVFTLDGSGKNQAAVHNSLDYSINSDFDRFPGSRPEATGAYLTIYATGAGLTSPAVADGQGAPAATLALVTGTTRVFIGGTEAQVLYSGLAPNLVGLWQINVAIPDPLPTNLATSLKVELRAKETFQPTTVAVANKNEFGKVTGKVLNAVNGAAIPGAGLTLSGPGTPRNVTSDASGNYNFYTLNPGSYTLTAAANGFINATQPTTIAGGQTKNIPLALSSPLASNQYRVVLSWEPGLDLDAHLTGPLAGNSSRFHVWWNEGVDVGNASSTATFERDDATGAGPESLTFTAQAGGVYRFSVQNYTDRDYAGGRTLFANTAATVRVYNGSQQLAVINVASGGGTLWRVFEINGGALNVVNTLTDEPDPSNIKTTY